jgi:hypothetical protein
MPVTRNAFRLPLLVPVVWLGLMPVANAALVRIDFTGTNSSPGATNVWGTPVPDLVGYLVYDDATAGSPFSATATNYAGAIKEIYFSMGSGGSTVFSGSRVGSFGSAQVQNAPGGDRLSFNNMVLTSSQLEGEVPTVGTRTFNNAQLTFGLAGAPSTIDNQNLLGIDPLAFTGAPRNLSVFLSYSAGTAPTPAPALSYNYNFSSLSVTPVPLPAAAWLLLSGLAGLGILGRRRRS